MNTLHEKYMTRCLELAQKGLPYSMPNPSIGAVLVFQNRIIGEGFTSPHGGNHAEVNCFASVQEKDKQSVKDATLYVSMEPCTHFGKTPPCCDLVVEQNVAKIVIGSLDPNPEVSGKSIKKLKAKGISVEVGILEQECQWINRRFYTFHQKNRPYIILKWAQSKDGFFAPTEKKQHWISNPQSKLLVHQWRSEEMAILVGRKTAEIDNPQLNVRKVTGKNPLRVVIDPKLTLSQELHLFDGKQNTLVFCEKQPLDGAFDVEYRTIVFGEKTLTQILDQLHRKNIQSIIIEGGAATLQQFITQNLWDEARVITGNTFMNESIKAPQFKKRLIEEFQLDNDTITIYKNDNL